jgi:hypothetical protein
MDTTYFERRLAVSIESKNAATDPDAHKAHRGMVNGYRALAIGKPKRIALTWPEAALAARCYDIKEALDGWADDGGSC